MSDSNSSLKLNRRGFLRIIGAGAALTGVGAALQACASAPAPTPVPPTPAPTPTPPTYARMTTTPMKLDKLDEAGPFFREHILPSLQQADGFRGIYELHDPKTGKSILITLWATEAAMKALESNGAYNQALASVKDLVAGPPTQQDLVVGIAA